MMLMLLSQPSLGLEIRTSRVISSRWSWPRRRYLQVDSVDAVAVAAAAVVVASTGVVVGDPPVADLPGRATGSVPRMIVVTTTSLGVTNAIVARHNALKAWEVAMMMVVSVDAAVVVAVTVEDSVVAAGTAAGEVWIVVAAGSVAVWTEDVVAPEAEEVPEDQTDGMADATVGTGLIKLKLRNMGGYVGSNLSQAFINYENKVIERCARIYNL